MSRINVPSRSRASSHTWPHVAVLVLVGMAAAGCSDSARFDSNPYASNRNARQQEATGSIASHPATASRVESQPLPAPSRPATVASTGGVATGAQGLGAYRPGTSDVTGSVPARAAPAPTGHWTWDGGSPVTVTSGETVESIARKYGVPASAISVTNGFREGAVLRPGQRVVIPRYVSAGATQASAPQSSAASRATENVHIVEPGESMLGIARKHGVTITALARANNIQPYAKISMGDRLTIPGGRHVAERQVSAPQVAQPRIVPAEKVASASAQTARVVTPEHQTTESVTQTAEAAGGIPSFRWPVKGRIITGFGPRPNGVQNDGINLAVPEGTPVKAADDGVVAYAGNELKSYGNLILIRHANGFVSAYANASELLVKRGDTIKRGQVIAHAGQTGNVTSPQLHFEIRKGSTPVDPTKYLGGA
ncbi:MAG TPA: peptidoglycan DD-metalloendopeptidase family protein [Pseudolabrys sp.]|nr:peptidoglycan DD-metalloendopeptidase family protein [Pseudolabrys sp.]